MLDATEKKLIHIQTRVRRAKKPLRGDDTHSGRLRGHLRFSAR
jgi:hypothetical protein